MTTYMNASLMRSTDGGAPVIQGTGGKGLAFLQAILLNGYNWQSIPAASITAGTSVGTASLTNHGFNIYQRLMMVGMDQALFLYGPSANNTYGDGLYPQTVPTNGNSFTFPLGTGTSTTATTGGGAGGTTTTLTATVSTTAQSTITIATAAHLPSSIVYALQIDSEWMLVTAGMGTTTQTVVRGFGGSTAATHANGATVTQVVLVGVAPAGGWGVWTQPYSGTNGGDFRSTIGSQMYLDVDDNTSAQYMRVRGYATMSAYQTGTGPYPTTGQVAAGSYNWDKSASADTTSRPWVAQVSGTYLMVFVDCSSLGYAQNNVGSWQFGDLIGQTKSGDAYPNLIIASNSTGSGTDANFAAIGTGAAAVGHYMPASYTQIGSSINVGKLALDARAGGGATMGVGGLTYPHPPDLGLYMCQVAVTESVSVARGIMPGVWCIMHSKPGTQGDIYTGAGPFAGKMFLIQNVYNAGQIALEISNTISAT